MATPLQDQVEYHTTIASTNQDHISSSEYINKQKTYITSLDDYTNKLYNIREDVDSIQLYVVRRSGFEWNLN